jgi:pimeloyl-ACP methyl ester carboxylesterase
MPSVRVRNLRLNYQAWGPAGQRAGVVLVHGLGSSSHIWDYVAPRLAEHSRRVVAVDQRGHGESDQPETGYDFTSVVADLAGFADAVGMTEPSVYVGHSWGASVVLHFAVTHPNLTASIALVDGGTSAPGERWSWSDTETRLRPPDLDGMQWSDLLERITRNNGAYPQSRAEVIARSVFDVDADGRVRRRFRIPNHMQVVRAMWEQRPADLLAKLQRPALLLPARQSTPESSEMNANKAAGIERARASQPQVRVRWFDDTVHDVPLHRPEELAAEILALVDQTLPSRVAS